MWDCVNLKWDVAGKDNAHTVGSLDQYRLKRHRPTEAVAGKSRTVSSVNKELVESWAVGAAVREVSITKQADWILI